MKLTKVAIGADRYFHKFRLTNGSTVTVATTKTVYDNLAYKTTLKPTYTGATYLMSSGRIGFNTPSGELSDGQYATQANGAHWVKIAGYPMTKLPNEYIKNNILSAEGEAKIIQLSQNE